MSGRSQSSIPSLDSANASHTDDDVGRAVWRVLIRSHTLTWIARGIYCSCRRKQLIFSSSVARMCTCVCVMCWLMCLHGRQLTAGDGVVENGKVRCMNVLRLIGCVQLHKICIPSCQFSGVHAPVNVVSIDCYVEFDAKYYCLKYCTFCCFLYLFENSSFEKTDSF